MSFKIVKTIENNIVIFSIVPEKWEHCDILFWPPKHSKNLEKMIRDPNSIPTVDWVKMPCTVKERNIESYLTAKKLCSLYEKLTETDAEVENFERGHGQEKIGRKRPHEKSQKLNDNIVTGNSFYNDEILVVKAPDNDSAVEMDSNFTIVSKLEEMNEKINNMDLKLDIFIKGLAEVKTLLQTSLNKSNEINDIKTDNEDILEFNFPINSVAEIEEFENKLSNRDFEQKMFAHFIKIGGSSGTQNGEKIASRLIREIFTNAVLCQFTWKGVSSKLGRPNAIFIKYEKILSFLFKILQKADRNFTRIATEKFLQVKVFKRNTQRLQREMAKKRRTDENQDSLFFFLD